MQEKLLHNTLNISMHDNCAGTLQIIAAVKLHETECTSNDRPSGNSELYGGEPKVAERNCNA